MSVSTADVKVLSEMAWQNFLLSLPDELQPFVRANEMPMRTAHLDGFDAGVRLALGLQELAVRRA